MGLKQGHLIFEDDGVQYPAFTLLPLREKEDPDAPLLSLVSVWLLLALKKRYQAMATDQLCQRHSAVRIDAKIAPTLLDFLTGRSSKCPLLVRASALSGVPPPSPVRLPRPPSSKYSRPAISPALLRELPGTSAGSSEEPPPAAHHAASRPAAAPHATSDEFAANLLAVAEVEAALCRLEL